jgi:hypothetical protein
MTWKEVASTFEAEINEAEIKREYLRSQEHARYMRYIRAALSRP